ncbi:MAG: mismatch repair protein MutS2 [Clostridiales bacterium]|jgi:DNA mismatch repair protein MutS2|nr:mismatch repair protein MutS2 [Clostridiales bacterium]
MYHRTLKILEFDKIIRKLKSKAFSALGADTAEALSPSLDRYTIDIWQRQTDEAVSYIRRLGLPPLEGIKDVKDSVNAADVGATLRPKELLDIASVIKTARLMKGYAQENENADLIADLCYSLHSMKAVEDEIYRCILSEDEIADDATPELKDIRRHIAQANQRIRDKLNDIIHSTQYQRMLQDPIVTIRNGRYVVPIKQEYRSSFAGLIQDQSGSGATLFIEPMAVVEANNDLRAYMLQEQEEIERILASFSHMIGQHSEDILNDLGILAQLDLIFAKGQLSIEMNAVRPLLTEDDGIIFKRARHPLIDPDKVVPIDLELGRQFTQLIITGPNTGGKTVTLKTIGLLTLMAQAGLHVPAGSGTQIRIFTGVYADIGDEQSIEQSLSTFSSHMTNIVHILNSADHRSLVLLDELGAGTDPTEGAALAMAILDELRHKGAIVAATTHYSQLKAYALKTPGVINAGMEFDVETLRPTYRLIVGVPGKSNAFIISRKLGLSDEVLARAQALLNESDLRFEDVIGKLEEQRHIAEKERAEAARALEQARLLEQKYQQLNTQLEQKRNDIIHKARQEAKAVLNRAKSQADQIIKELRDAQMQASKEANKTIEQARTTLKKEIEELSPEQGAGEHYKPVTNVKPGMQVYIVPLRASGFILTPPDANGNVQVQVGIMKAAASLSDLAELPEHEAQVKIQPTGKAASTSRSRDVGLEIDVRGQMLEEALANIDKYLDDAAISGLEEVFIIHGKGTGVLRTGIQDFLRHHPHVASYRTGRYGEGEMGVTVVKLK